MPPLRSHKVTIFVDTSDTNLRCEIHPRESLELFCEACGVLTCRDCQLSVHREHGGHRWVGEKAELLKPSLAETVSSFEEKLQLLSDSSQLVSRASSKSGSLRTSVAAVKDTLKKRAAALIKAIETHTKRLEAEVDERANEYLFRLTKAESQMRVLQERIEFTLQLTKSLLENAEKDPASLVQLSTRLQARLANLADQTDWLVSDETVSNGAETDSRTLTELQKTQGWRSSALARVLHLDGHDMTDLVSQSMVVVWTREKALRSELREGKTGSLEGTLSPSRLSPRSQPTGVGCRILLSLLTHPESTPFASNSVCPVCSLSLFPPNLTDESVEDDGSVATILQDCPSQWPFHQLVFLRAILEANSPNNSSPFAKHLAADVVNMDIGTWISRLDSVLAAATQPSDQPFALPDVQKAATVLRDVLDTAVERFYPTFFSS
ncbi:unnamed protein product [Dibothriocephalus latus]|uniref:B box-type domain-containing protein n=1 Tax=Dibothriocephalus latus TaxID=60516 RepID=A0A3P6UX04_DIBLA|nr:unnamed protein product [Dibothriocephalus latus]